jgi:hypothetical protein
MSGHTARRREVRTLSDLDRALNRRRRPLPTTVLWRWRYELAAVGVLTAAGIGAVNLVGAPAAALVCVLLLLLVAAVVVLPSVRRVLAARVWCVVTPHRVRTGCAQAGVFSRSGRLPAVLLTRPTKAGERVVLWCPAGTSVDDFVTASGLLRAACWAQDVQAARHPKYGHIVTLDVRRRAWPRSSVPRRPNGAAMPAVPPHRPRLREPGPFRLEPRDRRPRDRRPRDGRRRERGIGEDGAGGDGPGSGPSEPNPVEETGEQLGEPGHCRPPGG